MSLLDIFTGDPAKEAAESTRNYLSNTANYNLNDIARFYGGAAGSIQQGGASARDNINTGYGRGADEIVAGRDAGLSYINQGTSGALDALRTGREGAVGAYAPLTDLAARYGDSTRLYQDALGVNGADAAGAARDAFQPTLSYNFNLDQGLEAINRRRAAGGMLNSGNADRDAQEFGAGLASRESAGWLDRLAGFINPELAATQGAASGIAGAYTNEGNNAANVINTGGTNAANIATSSGRSLADIATGRGTALAGIDTGEATSLANLATGQAAQTVGARNAIMQPYANTYGQEAQAEMQGSGNIWNLGMNLARLGTGIWGGMGGGSQMVNGYNVGSTGGGNPFPTPI